MHHSLVGSVNISDTISVNSQFEMKYIVFVDNMLQTVPVDLKY